MVLAASLAGCTGAAPAPDAGLEPPLGPAVAYLARGLGSGTVRPADAVRAVSRLPIDLTVWPPDTPVLDRLAPPAGDAPWSATLWTTHAVGVAGHDPRTWLGVDLVEAVWSGHDGAQFGQAASITDDMWAVLALHAAGESMQDVRVADVVDRLHDAQADDGGWAYDAGPRGSPDETAWALLALQAAGGLEAVRPDVLVFLDGARREDGSYATAGVGANCQSTAWAIVAHQVLHAVVPPSSLAYLRACQTEDGGFAHRPGGPSQAWATVDAVTALAGTSWPWPRYMG